LHDMLDTKPEGVSLPCNMGMRPQRMRGPVPVTGSKPDGAAAPSGPVPHGFEAAVLAHLDAAYTLAAYLTRRGDAAEDIVQEALLRAHRSFASQRGENVRAWLLAIVRNCFLTWKARNRLADSPHLEDIGGEDSYDTGQREHETPESLLIQHQESLAVRAIVEALPQLFREVLVLRDIEDMSYREIADITSVPVGTVMSRLSRARKMFAAAWRKHSLLTAKEINS
jgi:RNA polymerase sigma factor (sigma-70 family)